MDTLGAWLGGIVLGCVGPFWLGEFRWVDIKDLAPTPNGQRELLYTSVLYLNVPVSMRTAVAILYLPGSCAVSYTHLTLPTNREV